MLLSLVLGRMDFSSFERDLWPDTRPLDRDTRPWWTKLIKVLELLWWPLAARLLQPSPASNEQLPTTISSLYGFSRRRLDNMATTLQSNFSFASWLWCVGVFQVACFIDTGAINYSQSVWRAVTQFQKASKSVQLNAKSNNPKRATRLFDTSVSFPLHVRHFFIL